MRVKVDRKNMREVRVKGGLGGDFEWVLDGLEDLVSKPQNPWPRFSDWIK